MEPNLNSVQTMWTEMVRQEMVKRFGEEEAYTKGYKVFTTVLSKDQAKHKKPSVIT